MVPTASISLLIVYSLSFCDSCCLIKVGFGTFVLVRVSLIALVAISFGCSCGGCG